MELSLQEYRSPDVLVQGSGTHIVSATVRRDDWEQHALYTTDISKEVSNLTRRSVCCLMVCALVAVWPLSGQALAADKVLRVWDWLSPTTYGLSYKEWFDYVEAEFEKRNPGIDVQIEFYEWGEYPTKFVNAFVSGMAPDVAQASVNWARDWFEEGMLLDLRKYIKPGSDASPEKMIPATQVYNRKGDAIYGITYAMDSTGLYYNVDFFEEAGLDAPSSIATWDGFTKAANKLTVRRADGTIARAGFTTWIGIDMFAAWLTSNGGTFYNATENAAGFNNSVGADTLQFLQEVFHKHRVYGGDFLQGTAAMAYAGNYWGGTIEDKAPKIRFGFTQLPKGPNGKTKAGLTWGNMSVIPSTSRQPDLAWKFVEFYTSLESSLKMLEMLRRLTSPLVDFYKTPQFIATVAQHPWLKSVLPVALAGGTYPFLGYEKIYAETQPILWSTIWDNTMAPREAVTQMSAVVNRILQGK